MACDADKMDKDTVCTNRNETVERRAKVTKWGRALRWPGRLIIWGYAPLTIKGKTVTFHLRAAVRTGAMRRLVNGSRSSSMLVKMSGDPFTERRHL